MNKYIELLMRYLVLECACVTSRTGKNGGICQNTTYPWVCGILTPILF